AECRATACSSPSSSPPPTFPRVPEGRDEAEPLSELPHGEAPAKESIFARARRPPRRADRRGCPSPGPQLVVRRPPALVAAVPHELPVPAAVRELLGPVLGPRVAMPVQHHGARLVRERPVAGLAQAGVQVA